VPRCVFMAMVVFFYFEAYIFVDKDLLLFRMCQRLWTAEHTKSNICMFLFVLP